jgi:hypothetical protein
VTTSLQSVTIDRALLLAAVAELCRAETKAGHLAIRVTQEHLGYCGYRGCAPSCVEHRALVAALMAALS